MVDGIELSLVDVELTNEEKNLISKIVINRNYGQLSFCGSSVEQLRFKIIEKMQRVGNNSKQISEAVANISLRHVMWMCAEHEADSFWLAMRVTPAISEYDVPRWHRDGFYFPSSKKVYKLVHTLVGAPTRFAKIVDLEKFTKLESRQIRGDESIELRKDIDTAVEEIFPTPSSQQAVQFLVGHDDAVIHSEPTLKSPRLFYSIVVGSKQQISII